MTVELLDLWLPIVLGAVIVFIAGSLAWMALPHHKADIKPLPDEDAYKDAIKGLNIPAGLYMYPHCHTPTGEKHADAAERYKTGPWGLITVSAGMPNFVRNLAINFIECLAISFVVAYLCTIALPPTDDYMRVFRFAGTAAFLGFALGSFSNDAFLGKPSRFQVTCLIDAAVYALLVAGVFAWLWPEGGLPINGADAIPTP
ncbi:MAG: hypothetical protein DHS20C14_06440 [Phycisphaeraceae bacterium]|nr:MAG: hypothetical protein DHS20C14_06440 [Phycisphaeraceae bacterium]